jgi:hypothetical protein
MRTMISEVYDAFMSAGAEEAKARAAAQAIANNEARFMKIGSDLRLLTWIASSISAMAAWLVTRAFV